MPNNDTVMDIKDITLKYNQEKESTIQYDVFELLQTDLSDCMKKHLRKLNSSNIEKLLSLFNYSPYFQFETNHKNLKSKIH